MPGCYIIGRAIGTRHDEKNLIVSTRYADGSFLSNAYSCCRRLSPIDDGIEIVITETGSGKLEHTWRITNESRSASRVRLQKISRLNNLMSDTTFAYVNGEWTEFDNISESSEQLISEDSLSTDGVKREERIVRHPDGQVLFHAITELTRIGSFADAVLRETYHAEKGWGDNWKESFASYYDDSAHPKRHGNVRLVWGNDRPWKFSAYDGEGRPVLTLEQHDGSACPTNDLAWIGADFHGYDVFGNRIAVTNALGSVTSTSFDADNRPSAVSGATYSLRQGYDAEGRRTNLSTTRDGQVWDETHWTYDAATGLCTVKRYADDSTVAYTHTQYGKPLRTTFPSGRWSENEYNVKRERTAVRFSDGGTDTFVYDEFSQEIAASNAVAAVVLLRTDDGAITNELWRIGTEERTLERAYDSFGRLSANDGAVCSYAEDGRLATITTADATVNYSYAADREDAGYVLTLANGVSFVRTVTRDPYRRSLVTGISNQANGVEIESLAYTYDALNRPILRNADSFGYNARSEVTSATIGGHSATYAYDDIGNSLSYSANNLNQYTEFDYDLDGNLLTDNALDFTYDAANRLKTVSSNGVLLVTNDYDAKSRRVRKTTPGATTTYFYDNWNLVEERIAYTSGATSTIRYHWGNDHSGSLQGAGGVGGLLYLTIDGNVYVPFYDNNGNVTHYCDATGAVVAAYTYDAFGNTIAKSGDFADLFRHRFSTKYYDAESGLYYYGYRFYHPTLMRWLNRDPIEEDGGVNLYGFCKNSPVSLYDNFGLFTIHIHTEGVGHVGIMTKEGVAYDYGRYFGKYSTGLTGKMDQAGPNILIRGSGPSNKHSYTRYKFSVCPLVDKKVTEELNKQFASGAKGLPSDVIARYDVAPKIPLADNMRYMGSDWSINNNCQTFTFRAIANAARAVGEDQNATRLERQQATAMISLSFLSCWQPAPVAVKKMLSGFAKDSKWITEER